MTVNPDGGPRLTWPGREDTAADADTGTAPSGDDPGRLVEETRGAVDPTRTCNRIIEGDNLPVCRLLAADLAGRVRVVYMDPPYNTGKRFVYDDGGRLGARRVGWLEMMLARLRAVYPLLAPEGSVMVSIGDEEMATLRLLLDEVFGPGNHVATFVVQRSLGGGLARQVVTGHDYVLVYARDIGRFRPLRRAKDIRGPVVSRNGEEYWIEDDWLRREFGPYKVCEYRDIAEALGAERAAAVEEGLAEGRYRLIERRDGRVVVGRLRKIAEDSSKLYSVLRHLNRDARTDLAEIGMPMVFDYPKPVSLLEELIGAATFGSAHDGAVVLDAFAGSGSTGQAVMALNAADGGNRSFVLIQSPEPIRGRSGRAVSARSLCAELGVEPTIAELTRERIRRAGSALAAASPGLDVGFRSYRWLSN